MIDVTLAESSITAAMQTVPTTATPLEEAIVSRSAVIGIIGLGYVGLPLVQSFVQAGYRTMGFDIDPQKCEMLWSG